ncbi:MAG: ABC transporter substrate-binding protein [Gammaproteobacteria bacterium]|jgi:microcin C transport system substrate-binding protein|nr:ABC transporter substrate-binding protein [Gammaproteobacteria bacterium]MBT4493202.1 ABC transporter substrate-binding protein [Gammaproteobacteria bacterium]MBT7369630.1 ABC transporter substrate-binding protein [Gammaproteobacteria bacterium]
MKLTHITGLALLLLIAACGGPSDDADQADFAALDNTAEVEAYYAEKPDFFSFKTLADLPTDLTWQNGEHLPEMGSPEAKKGGIEYARLQDFPRTLRTVGPDSNGSFRVWILDDVTISIAHRHQDAFEFFPGLAEAWAVDKPNKTIYVKLDPAATWSDGVPITADDFLFMFFFYQSSYIVAPWYNNWYGTQYTNITKYDDLTFSISIPEAKPDMDARVLELRPVPHHFFKELGDDYVERYQWRFAPTTAAYVVKDEDIRKGRSATLTRLENWWAKDKKHWRYRFNPDRIHLSVIRDTPKVFEAFKRGDIDQFGLNLAEYWYEKLPNDDPDVAAGYIHKSVFYNQRPRPTYGLWINTSRPILENRDVRIGINHASNWDLVIEKFFRGDYNRMQTSSDGYGEFSHPELRSREFSIEKAQDAFASAGFAERGPDGILVNDKGERLSFTLSTGYENLKDVLTILKEEAAKAGLEFRIEVLDGTAGWKKVQEKKHDIHFSAFSVSLEMYPRFWETYHSDNAYDGGAFLEDGSVNPERKLKTQTNNLEALAIHEMDDLINQYRASDDREEMIRLAYTMTEMHHEHASFVPAFYQPFYRLGHWQWIRYPKSFNHKHSRGAGQLFVHWIDTALKEETQKARKDGVSLDPEINIYDQFATP